jgi:hypothetical protein
MAVKNICILPNQKISKQKLHHSLSFPGSGKRELQSLNQIVFNGCNPSSSYLLKLMFLSV